MRLYSLIFAFYYFFNHLELLARKINCIQKKNPLTFFFCQKKENLDFFFLPKDRKSWLFSILTFRAALMMGRRRASICLNESIIGTPLNYASEVKEKRKRDVVLLNKSIEQWA
jgi:hypothetical protein